jgi:rRNA processing protein Gar1
MGRDNYRRRPQPKRRFHQTRDDEIETVDDLAHAAQFAIFPNSAVASTSLPESGDSTKKKEDDNEIEVGDDDDDDSHSDASIADATPNENGGKTEDGDAAESESDDDDSDGESDDDLAEALQRMEQASTKDEANMNSTTSHAPKTENEVDGYSVPIQELESQLQIKLTVQEGTITTTTNNGMDVSMNEVSLAGKIKNYLMVDRTVVIESITNPSSPGLQQRALDEGSLLVIKKPDNADDDKDASTASWIPLGRIFEVFGPVSQPLYTIRLPSPPNSQKKKSSGNRNSKKNPKKKVSSNDTEQTKESEAKMNTHQDDSGTTTVRKKESNEGNIADDTTAVTMESPKEGGKSIIMGEETSNPKEKNSAIQSPSSPTPCQTTTHETSDVRENKDATLSSPSKAVEKSLPTQEKETVESETENANPNNDEQKVPIVDPWAVDGEYAKFLSQQNDVQVYFIEDEAKLIDTGLVLRISAKGCDASNIYDEEIIDSNEAYYSDDEKEREAKNKRKGRKKTQQRNNNDDNRQQKHPPRAGNYHQQQFQHNAPAGFSNTSAIGHHGRPTPPPPHPPPPPQNHGYGQHARSLPQGFHRVTQQQMPHGGFQQQQQQQQQPLYQYPAQSSFRGHAQASIPPPPPPPPMHGQPNPYQRTAPPSYPPQAPSSMRPPPPPRNPNEPPAYQY